MTTKPNKTSDYTGLFLFIVMVAAVIFLAIDKCSTNDSIKESSDMETKAVERENDRKEEKELEKVTDTILVDRWRTKTKYDTIIQTVLMYDSAETDQAFDSLIGTKNNAVVIYYKGKRDSIQLVGMDSVHVIDTMRISLLRKANLDCDTLLASKDKAISELTKHGKKQYLKGFIHGIGVGSIGTLLIVK